MTQCSNYEPLKFDQKANKLLASAKQQYTNAVFYMLISISPYFRLWDSGNGGSRAIFLKDGNDEENPTSGAKAALAFMILSVILAYMVYLFSLKRVYAILIFK